MIENFRALGPSCIRIRGGSRIFSMGGADFQKEIENVDDLFFVGQIDFLSSPKALFCASFGKIFEKSQKSVFRHFFENLVKLVNIGPSKLVNIGADSAFRKISNFRVGRPKVDFLKSTRGGHPPPLNPPLITIVSAGCFLENEISMEFNYKWKFF